MAEIHPVHWSEIKTRVDLCVLLQCSSQALDYMRIPDNSGLCERAGGGETRPVHILSLKHVSKMFLLQAELKPSKQFKQSTT